MTATVPQTAPAPDAPPPWVWGARIAALAVMATLLAFGVLSVVGMFAHRERITTHVFTQPITRLVTTTGTGDVRVQAGGTGDPVRVVTTIGDSFGTARSSETVEGDVLTLTGRCRFILLPDSCGVSYLVTVPPGTEVALDTGTGDVVVTGTSAGITIHTGTGDIQAREVRASRVAADTGTGDVALQFAAAPTDVTARSGTGDIAVTVPADGNAYRVVADTGVGEVTDRLTRNDSSTRSIRAESGTGDIRLEAR